MKKYLLLRDNQQSGPYTFEEMAAKELVATDLIWTEGKSTAWAFPNELEEFRNCITEVKLVPRKVFVQQPEKLSKIQPAVADETPELTTHISQPLGELRERLNDFQEKGPVWNSRPASSMNEILKVAALFGGLVVGAFMVKKAVDGFGTPPSASFNELPANIMIESPETETASEYKNALLTEIIPAKDTIQKQVKKVKPRDIKKQLTLKGNDYKVGVLGGINGLQLKLHNSSPHAIDKVVVAVQYLKPNGEVVHTDNYELLSIRPHGTRSLQVPDSKRGVKVKYRIVDIKSKDYSKALKQV